MTPDAACRLPPARHDTVGVVQYEVTRSAKRRKTVQARLVNGVVHISIPARMTKAEEQQWVEEMVERFRRREATAPIDLHARAEVLATRYGLPQPLTVRWVDNQEWRWGSCTPSERSIRISSRLAGYPAWVLDYVVIHELAHLLVDGHGADFWALVNRYPKAERARGFLIAKGLEDEEPQPAPPRRPAPKAAARPLVAAGQDTLW